MQLPLDLIDWCDLHELHLRLSSTSSDNDQRMRSAASRIVTPNLDRSVFDHDSIAMNTIRVLAACHDDRVYHSPMPKYMQCDESAIVLGLRRFSYEGQRLGDWSLIKKSPAAREYAKALVALTNVVWRASIEYDGTIETSLFEINDEEIWMRSEPFVDLAFRHAGNIDPILRIIDERHEREVLEIERIAAMGILSEGAL